MKNKIILALLCSAFYAAHAAGRLPRPTQIPRSPTQAPKLDFAARQAKAKQAFDDLPVNDSFDSLLGPGYEARITGDSLEKPFAPVPPPRHESLVKRGGEDRGTAAPPISMDVFKGSSPTSLYDFMHGPRPEVEHLSKAAPS